MKFTADEGSTSFSCLASLHPSGLNEAIIALRWGKMMPE